MKEDILEMINSQMSLVMDLNQELKEVHDEFRRRDLVYLSYILSNDEEGVTMSQIAKHFKVTPAAASQIITIYENKGWVERQRSKTDRRTVYVKVTDEIKEKLNKKNEEQQEKYRVMMEYLGPEDSESLIRILGRVKEYLQNLE
ncbi:MAG: MarR family transcriptional regulator [Faecalicoccus sp.]|nr:MarR family transcriptional regulator [Faecalicoccus sp.]